MDFEEMFSFEPEEHTRELALDRMEKLSALIIQDLPVEIVEGLESLLSMEIHLQSTRLQLQALAASEFMSEQVVKAKRAEMKTVKNKKKD